jgi:hypothetical protein
MRWTPGSRRNIEDRRGMRAGGGRGVIPIGIGGFVVLLLLSLFTGVDFLSLVGGGGPPVSYDQPGTASGPVAASPEEERLVDFVDAVVEDAQELWSRRIDGYRRTTTVLFRDAVDSTCGFAQSAVGPFYCPADQRVYLDLSFFNELHRRFGAPGDFAQAYVLAHEIGHHVQTLIGVEQQVRQRRGAQPLVHPSDDVLQAFDAMPRLAGARELVVFVREPHHHGVALQELERAEQLLAAGRGRRPPVLVAEDEHQRGGDVLHVRNRRALREVGRVLEGRFLEPGGIRQPEVGRVPEVGPVRDVALAHGRFEALGLRDHPIGQQPSAAATGDAHAALVHVAAFQDLVDTRHQILVVVARVLELNDVAEVLPVVGAAARVGEEHDVSLRRHPLEFVSERVAVRGMRSAVDLKNHRVLARRVEARRFEDPALNLLAVEARVPDLLGLAHARRSALQVGDVEVRLAVGALRVPASEPTNATRRRRARERPGADGALDAGHDLRRAATARHGEQFVGARQVVRLVAAIGDKEDAGAVARPAVVACGPVP